MNRNLTLAPREVKLTTRTNTLVRRTLPHRKLLTIGAWCFIDHYGPTDSVDAMSIAQHPHVGLQTVSWLFSGEIEHRDSLSSRQIIYPGQLNLMTSGRGIAHSELSLDVGKKIHGVQMWIALPEDSKDVAPHFEHHNDLPTFDFSGLHIKLMMGQWLGYKSKAKIYSELVGAEISAGQGVYELPIRSDFEYGILVDEGALKINGHEVKNSELHFMELGEEVIKLQSESAFRAILIGGIPFDEEIIMWWNFIGRTHEEIVMMREDWENQSPRFGQVEDRIGGRISAPALPNLRLKPRKAQPYEDK